MFSVKIQIIQFPSRPSTTRNKEKMNNAKRKRHVENIWFCNKDKLILPKPWKKSMPRFLAETQIYGHLPKLESGFATQRFLYPCRAWRNRLAGPGKVGVSERSQSLLLRLCSSVRSLYSAKLQRKTTTTIPKQTTTTPLWKSCCWVRRPRHGGYSICRRC